MDVVNFSVLKKKFSLAIFKNLTKNDLNDNSIIENFLRNYLGKNTNFVRFPYPNSNTAAVSLSHKRSSNNFTLGVVASKDVKAIGIDLEFIDSVKKCYKAQIRYNSRTGLEPVVEFTLREAAIKCLSPVVKTKLYFKDITFSPAPSALGIPTNFMNLFFEDMIIGIVFHE